MNAMRNLRDSVRYERLGLQRLGARIGGPGATIEGHWRTVIVSMILVFACFFAIGRASRVRDASHAAIPSTLQAASVRAGIPVGLAGGPLLGGAIPIARRTSPKVTRRPTNPSAPQGTNPSASAPSQPFTTETPQATLAPAPSESTSATAHTPPASSTHGSSRPSSGGGSFDSSE
jgi:hypothetical protein